MSSDCSGFQDLVATDKKVNMFVSRDNEKTHVSDINHPDAHTTPLMLIQLDMNCYRNYHC